MKIPVIARIAVTTALLACAFATAASTAAASDHHKRATLGSDRAKAEAALERVKDLLQGRGVRTGRELTPALAELARRQSALSRADRREAAALLARPTDGAADPQGDGYTVAEAAPHCTTHFCVHYVTSTADAPSLADSADPGTVPDYVETMANEFETSYTTENVTLGWNTPKSDGTLGGDSKTDVYIAQIGDEGIFGYAAPDPGQSGNARYSYVVMDDDYSEFGFANPLDALRVTAAHEYNHVLHFAYDSFQDIWMFESTATWMEDKVYDSINDYVSYLGEWAACTEEPLTEDVSTSACDAKIYGSAVWNHWLDEQYGSDVVERAWDLSLFTSPQSFAPGAYNAAIDAEPAGVSFFDDFNRFAAAAAEWRAPGSGFSEGSSFPDVERTGTLSVGGASATFTLDHTTFALVNVPVPASGSVVLNATIPSGTAGALALVGRTGASQTAGTVTKQVQQLPNGGSGSVELTSASSFGRITAVLVNADVSQNGFSFGQNDWNWTKDNQRIAAQVVAGGTPPDTTPPDTTITSGPSGTTSSTTASFSFAATESGAIFECSLDGSAFESCISPQSYSGLSSGSHTFQVRAIDASGNVDPTPASQTWTVSAGSGTGTTTTTTAPTSPATTTPLDTLAPTLGTPRLASTRFRAARSGPSIAATVGTRVTYLLSEPATTRWRVERAAAGRKVGGRCVRPTSSNRDRPRCTRWVRIRGSFRHSGRAGSNSFKFRGRIGGRTLRPGSYRFVVSAIDAAGNVSATKRVRFRIVR